MGENSKPCYAAQIRLNNIESRWMMIFLHVIHETDDSLTGDLCVGHLGSPEVTGTYLAITSDRCKIQRCAWCHCVRLTQTHRLICNMTSSGHFVTLTWGQILTLTFQGHQLYHSTRLNARNTMVLKEMLCRHWFTSYSRKKNVFDKTSYVWNFWLIQPKLWDLAQFWWNNGERASSELSFAFFGFALSIIVSEIMANIPKNTTVRSKSWPLLTSGDLNIDLRKKYPIYFWKTLLRAIDRLIACLPSPISFWVTWGGHFDPPPPPWRSWLRPPPGRGLNDLTLTWLDLTLSQMAKWPSPLTWKWKIAHKTCVECLIYLF